MSDLDWLAVNVPVGEIYRNCFVSTARSVVYGFHDSASHTKAEVEARREEMINRPKFEDHPDAKCFVQDEKGRHYKNTKIDTPFVNNGNWHSNNFGWHFVQDAKS